MLSIKYAIRLALQLHKTWAAQPPPRCNSPRIWRDLEAIVAEGRRLRNQIALATRYNLAFVLPRLTQEMTARLDNLARLVGQLRDESSPVRESRPDLAEWIGEVRQLEAEFGAIEIRWSERILRVVTEPIVLNEVPLGPFAIEFGWSPTLGFRGSRSFDVIALEPNSASGRDEVVHPHVEGRRLCSGDASEPLDQALDSGRLVDAFLLVRSVLTTYNPNSPYVALDEWHGCHCSDCGRRSDRHECSSCEGCDSQLCDECACSCTRCSATHCSDCLEPCAACGDSHCSACLTQTESNRAVCPDCRTRCPGCQAVLATDERNADTGLCAGCSEAPEPTPELEEVSSDAT